MKHKWPFWLIVLGLLLIVGTAIYYISSKVILNDKKISFKNRTISTVIVPHHDLVKDQRKEFFLDLAKNTRPKTIIIVSPDHFASGDGITTTDRVWKLANAEIPPNLPIINQLIDQKIAKKNDNAFEREHGVFNLLSDLQSNFPSAKLVPIILKQDLQKDKVDNLANKLNEICTEDCLLVSSIDFSHYQVGSLAEIHDSLSIRALTNLDQDLAWQAEVDSDQSLSLAISWAALHQTEKFVLKEHTNSGKINNSSDEETTSYVFGWFENGTKKEITNEFTFMIGGDTMLGRSVAWQFDNKLTEAFKNLGDRFFWGTDVSLVNLEGPISKTEFKSNPNPDNLIFNFPPEAAEALKWLHLNAVSLGNNHSQNQGLSGLKTTRELLSGDNIKSIGSQTSFDENSITRFSSGSKKLSILTINCLETDTDIISAIKEEKAAGNFVLIFPHWGNEYQAKHSNSQSELAYRWIDGGADLVIGSHPHVVQDAEIYQGKLIYYSLGNLVFDQSFSKETQEGMVIAAQISDTNLKIVFIPTEIHKNQVQIAQGRNRQDRIYQIMSQLGQKSTDGYGYDTININIK